MLLRDGLEGTAGLVLRNANSAPFLGSPWTERVQHVAVSLQHLVSPLLCSNPWGAPPAPTKLTDRGCPLACPQWPAHV